MDLKAQLVRVLSARHDEGGASGWVHVSVCSAPSPQLHQNEFFVLVVDPQGRDPRESSTLRWELAAKLSDATDEMVEVVRVAEHALRGPYGHSEFYMLAAASGAVLHGPPLADLIDPAEQ